MRDIDNLSNVETVNRFYQGVGSDLGEQEKQSMGDNSNYKDNTNMIPIAINKLPNLNMNPGLKTDSKKKPVYSQAKF